MLSSGNISRLTILLAVFILISTVVNAITAEELIDFYRVQENEHLILYMNRETTEIAIQEKSSGEVWYSNPPDRDTMEQRLRGSAKDTLKAQLRIVYYDVGDRRFEMDSYNDSVKNGQYIISELDNGVRVEYLLGTKWKEEDYTPLIIEKKKFETEVLVNLSESDREFLLDQYHLIDMVECQEGEEPLDIYGVNTEEVFRNYRIEVIADNLSDRDLRVLVQELLKGIVDGRGYASLNGLKHEDVKPLINNPTYVQKSSILPWDTERIVEVFSTSGYQPEKVQEDHRKYNFPVPHESIRNFSLAIEYRLDGQDFLVTVPCDSIDYPLNEMDYETGNRVTLPLSAIEVLPFFEAASTEKEGYMLIPDGSGALIELNNGKINKSPYKKSIYGRDYSAKPIKELLPFLDEKIYMPVFGLKQGDKGFLAIIEEGESLGNINAQVAGMRDSYNRVYPGFDVIPMDAVRLERAEGLDQDLSNLSINMYQARNYDRDIKIRYKLLKGKDSDYSGMARVYQEYLVDKYQLSKIEADRELPFFLELLGGIDKTLPVMGIPRDVVIPLTTYKQAGLIIEELLERGISKLAVKYNGWSRGGIRHRYPDNIRLESKLGDRESFDELLALLEENNIEFFPEIAFLNIYKNTLFDGFIGSRDNTRFLNRKQAFIYERFNISNFLSENKEKGILSTRTLDKLVNKFLDDYQEYNITGLSLRYLGEQVNSDFRVKEEELIDREQAKDDIIKQLEKLSASYKLAVNGGNTFVLPYSSYITNLNFYSDSSTLFDKGIPFYQMVLHGYFHYTGEPLNLAEKIKLNHLKLIECGAIPYYRWSYEVSSHLKKSDFDDHYSIYYRHHLDEAVEYYKELSTVLSELQTQRIIEHKEIENRVYQVLYEEGDMVIVNYNQEEVQLDGYIIPGEDYLFIKGDS